MLFESLNNRGVPLTAIDLIKNLIISVSEKDNKSNECYEIWREIQNNLQEEYVVQERFFRQYPLINSLAEALILSPFGLISTSECPSTNFLSNSIVG